MWLKRVPDDSITLTLHVQPGAKRTEFVGQHGDALKLRLAAPPVEGKANACLIAFIARHFKVSKNAVVLVSGEASRHKIVRVVQPNVEALRQLESLCHVILPADD